MEITTKLWMLTNQYFSGIKNSFRSFLMRDKIRILVFGICTIYFIYLSWVASYTALSYDESVHTLPAIVMYRYFHAIWNNPALLSPTKARSFMYGYYSGLYHMPYWVLFYYPPLYSIITTLVFLVLGINSYSARFFSIFCTSIFGIISYEFGKLLYNRKIGLFTTIFTISFFSIISTGVQALLDVPVAVLSLLTLYFFYKGILTQRRSQYILSGIFLGLSLLMKQTAITILPFIIIFYFLNQKNRNLDNHSTPLGQKYIFSNFLWFLSIAFLIFSPWYLFLALKHPDDLFGIFRVNVDLVIGPVWTIISAWFFWGYQLILRSGIFLAILVFIGFFYCLYRRNSNDLFILYALSVSLTIFTFISHKEWRFILVNIPVFFIFSSISIESISNFLANKINLKYFKRTSKKWKFTILFSITIFSVSYLGEVLRSVEYFSNPGYFDLTYVPLNETAKYVVANTPISNSRYRVLQIGWSNHFSPYAFMWYMMKNDNDARIEYWLLHSWETTPSQVDDFLMRERIYYVVIYIETGHWGDLKKPIDLDALAEKSLEYSIAAHMLKTQKYIIEKSFEGEPFFIFIVHPSMVL